MDLNNIEFIKERIINSGCRFACTVYRQQFISEILLFDKNMFAVDFTSLHTSYKDSVAGLLIDKYVELMIPHTMFRKVGLYRFHKKRKQNISAEKLLEIKRQNYHSLREYYNDKILHVLQKLNDHPNNKHNIYPIQGYQFKPLKDCSHLLI